MSLVLQNKATKVVSGSVIMAKTPAGGKLCCLILLFCLMSLETPVNENYFDTISSVLLHVNTLMVLYHLFMSSGSTGELELYRNKLEVKFTCKTSRRQKPPNRRQKKLATNHRLSRGKVNYLPNI